MRDNRALLKPEYARASPPFAANQFTDAAFRSVIRFIWMHASAETKVWYDRARVHEGDNWIISWMLYHVCRYRDPRNIRATSSNFHDDDDLDEGGSSHGRSEIPENGVFLLSILLMFKKNSNPEPKPILRCRERWISSLTRAPFEPRFPFLTHFR